MPITVVQHKPSGNLSSTTTLGAGLTLGNWVLFAASGYTTGGSSSVPSSPTVGGSAITGTVVAKQVAPAGSDSTAVTIWLIPVNSTAAGQTVLDYSVTGLDGAAGAVAIEVSGLGASPAVDQSAGAAGYGSPASSGSTGAISAAEIVFGCIAVFGESFTLSGTWDGTDGPPNAFTEAFWKDASSGTFSAQATLSGGNGWAAGIVTVKPGGGGGSSHTATASLAVTPSFSAGRARGKYRTGSLLAVPSFSASRRAAHVRAGSLLVVPAFRAIPAGGAAQQGSWWGLVSVLRHSRQEFDSFISRPPVACPRCGEPLINAPATASGSGVQLFCKFDGWQYPRDWHAPTRYGPGADL